jgi:hypothetical protein
MNTISPDRAVTAEELREYLRRDRLELYVIVHLADGLRPKGIMSNHAQHARLNWLKDRIKDGRLPALLDGDLVNMRAAVTYHDLARIVDEDAPEPFISFLPKWVACHKLPPIDNSSAQEQPVSPRQKRKGGKGPAHYLTPLRKFLLLYEKDGRLGNSLQQKEADARKWLTSQGVKPLPKRSAFQASIRKVESEITRSK